MAEAKKNPFDKLAKKGSAAAASAESESDAEMKERLAAKRAAREAAKAEEAAAVESDIDDNAEQAEQAEAVEEKVQEPEEAKPAPKKSASTRRTAKQVEEEYQAKLAEQQAKMDSLLEKLGAQAGGGIEVVQDRVVLEGGVGGDVRVVGDGKTLTNDEWRVTLDGLRLIMGRASAQTTQTFVIPAKLAVSLGEVLSQLPEIKQFKE